MSSKNKGADLRHRFAYAKSRFSHATAHMLNESLDFIQCQTYFHTSFIMKSVHLHFPVLEMKKKRQILARLQFNTNTCNSSK